MNLKSVLTTNIEMKLFSVLLAAVIWLLVVVETVDEIEIPLSVSYANTPAGLTVRAQPVRRPLISIEGPRILLLRQKLKGVSIRFDLAGAGEGEIVFSGPESPIKLIPGVKMLKFSPVKVELHR
jgi:hypothetical protein